MSGWQSRNETAVASYGCGPAWAAVAEDPVVESIDGDSIDSDAVGGAYGNDRGRHRRSGPKVRVHGAREQHLSSKYNSEPEVGNFGLMMGNWGLRGNKHEPRQETHDRQVLRSPAHVMVIVEATRQVGVLLAQPSVEGTPGGEGLYGRKTREHFVIRGEEKSDVLIAARKDNTTGLRMLCHRVWDDHHYKEDGQDKMARSRALACEVAFKQNIGHLGKDIRVCGVHGHFRTMKMEWVEAYIAFWDRLADAVKTFRIQFMAGDFNMSLTEVPKQLRSRGIDCNCAAWYPWHHDDTMDSTQQSLGFDSCGIFYIGGPVEIKTPWNLGDMQTLTSISTGKPIPGLDRYHGQNVPGQPWTCYRSRKCKETSEDKNLKDRLRDLLTLTTTTEELERIPRRKYVAYCPYLRLKQKELDCHEWLVDGNMHNGAHFPLCVFTNNSSARSETRAKERGQDRHERFQNSCNKGSGKSANMDKRWAPQSRPPLRKAIEANQVGRKPSYLPPYPQDHCAERPWHDSASSAAVPKYIPSVEPGEPWGQQWSSQSWSDCKSWNNDSWDSEFAPEYSSWRHESGWRW